MSGSHRPGHVAIIMDGNGRWATRRGLPRLAGHRRGVESAREIIRCCPELGVERLTLFAFSTENWKRSDAEITGLMRLFRRYITKEASRLVQEGVRVRFIGGRDRLDPKLCRLMDGLEHQTGDNSRLFLTVALNYGGRDELARAARRLSQKVANGKLSPGDVNEEALADCLDTAGMPDPDLIIRTSGEARISNFLLWQAAYAEYAFEPTLWPDFTPDIFARCLDNFGQRERRFGAVVG
ncbi:MAG: polyprenyl diphosphate synthase [Paracoccaceae bacterium]